jgi:hypothetical protein
MNKTGLKKVIAHWTMDGGGGGVYNFLIKLLGLCYAPVIWKLGVPSVLGCSNSMCRMRIIICKCLNCVASILFQL